MKRREFLTGAVAGAAAGAAAGWLTGRQRGKRDGAAGHSPSEADPFRKSYSQQGEDIVMYHVLHDDLKISNPTFIDVGAAEPLKSNNTYLLYLSGARGVLVEPNPMYVAKLREKRPGDKVVAAGIGVTEATEADYYEIKGAPMLNTFSAEQAAYLQKEKGNVVERVTKMPLININRLIAEQLGKAPDLLSTDIEGWDETVIKSLDLSKYRPGCICAEGVPMYDATRQSGLMQYLLPLGYTIRGGSTVNTVYVDARRL